MARRKTLKQIATVSLLFMATVLVADEPLDLRLWYQRPAENWEEALPIGSGRLGAMVFGGVNTERIQFNEDTLWTGQPHDYVRDGSTIGMPPITITATCHRFGGYIQATSFTKQRILKCLKLPRSCFDGAAMALPVGVLHGAFRCGRESAMAKWPIDNWAVY